MVVAGKLIAGTLGFVTGNITGLVFGLVIGHIFDRSISHNPQPFMRHIKTRPALQDIFFSSTFLVMGKIAKADGRVTEQAISDAQAVMRQMSLNDKQKQRAIDLFNRGKQSNYDISSVLAQLGDVLGQHQSLAEVFLEIQLQIAYNDGQISSNSRKLLQKVCHFLRINQLQFEYINRRIAAQQRFDRQQAHTKNQQQLLVQAYSALGVTANCSPKTVKIAYRRLMSQHHPDKLVAKGLPPEMLQLAKENTQKIQQAYELIKKSRKAT